MNQVFSVAQAETLEGAADADERGSNPIPSYPSQSCVHLPAPAVWMIDDSPTICAIVMFYLCQRGIAVQSFATGTAALLALAHQAVPVPQLILLDLELPVMDGYDVTRSLRVWPSCAHTAIVLVSGHDGVIDRVKGRLVGANGYLCKPFDCQTLWQVVSRHLGPLPRPMPLREQ